jgi:hypothetical protein
VATLAAGPRSLSVVYTPGATHGVVIGSNLAPPPQGKVYELWFRIPSTTTMRPAGTFTVRGGQVRAPVTLGSSFDLLAVSVEPRGGSKQPTTTPIYVKEVRPAS